MAFAATMRPTVCRLHTVQKVKPFQRTQQHAATRSLHCKPVAASSTIAGSNIRIDVQGRHIEVTPAINEYATKKLSSAVEPFKSGVREVEVRLSVRGGDTGSKGEKQQTMEVTIRTVKHGLVRAEVSKDDLYAAIDIGCDKVVRSLRKLKEKSIARGSWPGRGSDRAVDSIADAMQNQDLEVDVEPSDTVKGKASSRLGEVPESVKRTKVFYLDPMSLADAVDKLEYVDHDFYLYLDADSGHTQAVYKRRDGTHGVIITVPDESASAATNI